MTTSNETLSHLEEFGFALLRGAFDAAETEALRVGLTRALATDEPAVLRSRGRTYGSRNLVALWPDVCEIPRRPRRREFIQALLGAEAGLVRALYFDKPPDRSWSLPWHKDRTIAVKANDKPTSHFQRPTIKAGIPHVEAPESLLTRMLTLRVHLDAMTAENGPLSVIPGSHILARERATSGIELHTDAGDVLAMRPLISHSSSMPSPGNSLHRRVIHLEFAPSAHLPDNYEWYSFDQIGQGDEPRTDNG